MKWYWKITKFKSKSAPLDNKAIKPVEQNSSTAVQPTSINGNADKVAKEDPSISDLREPSSSTGIKITSLPLGSITNKRCIKAKLIKTNKKDFLCNPRYENLDIVRESDTVKLEYMDDTKTYLVLDVRGNELGEIGCETSLKILKSDQNSITASIDCMTENKEGNYDVLIKVYLKQ